MTTIQNLSDLQDRRIMMEKRVPPFGYAMILLVAGLLVFLTIWSTQNYRTYVSQSAGTVQASNKTYIMSSYSGSITELNISEGSYVNEGDLIAHVKSTDIDMQQDSYKSQLEIYQKQKAQYEKLLKSIQDDTNYFSETTSPTITSMRATRARCSRRPLTLRPIRRRATPTSRSRP